MRTWFVVAIALVGCEGKKNSPASTGSGSSSGSSSIIAATAPADAAAPADVALLTDAAIATDARLSDPHTLDYEHILDWETIGPLKIGMPAKQVVKLLGEPKDQSDLVEEGATGMYVTDWEWPATSITIRMSSAKLKGPYRVTSIQTSVPNELTTSRGATIGTPASELPALYLRNVDEGTNDDPNQYLVGSVYGGLLFTLKDGRLISIFLGAMAI
jgi:hypothetical protein